ILERRKPEVVHIEGVPCLREGCPGVAAAGYEDIVCRGDTVVGDADLVSAVGCNPGPIVARYRSACRVKQPCIASVSASAHIHVCQRETCHVDIVEAIAVQGWCDGKVCVSTRWCKLSTCRRSAVRRRQRAVVKPSIGV